MHIDKIGKANRLESSLMPKISDIQETPNPNAVKFILRTSQQRRRALI